MLPLEFQSHLSSFLSAQIRQFQFLGGGCINHAGRLETSKGVFFLKWNDKGRASMFRKEAQSLALLTKTRTIRIPEVVATGEVSDLSFLLLEYLPKDYGGKLAWQRFGQGLAGMHRYSRTSFGLEFDNYIGSLPQSNCEHKSWVDFFREERLVPQVALGVKSGRITSDLATKFDILYHRLAELLALDERPALLHGDLWSGNFLFTSPEVPCLVDPATYYGHREAEIAFTKLFGGFSDDFYAAYHECHPLAVGHEHRVGLFNLYPLLVHVNLFGGGYINQVKSILQTYL